MRKELLWPCVVALILVAVLYTQRKLKSIAENPREGENLPFFSDESNPQASDEQALLNEPSQDEETAPDNAETAKEPSSEGTAQDLPQPIKEGFVNAQRSFQQKEAIAASKDEDLHHTPKQTIEAARQMGVIVELEKKYPQHQNAFRDFYLQCVRDEATITAIRVRCLEKYFELAKLDEVAKNKLLSELPEAVVGTYRSL